MTVRLSAPPTSPGTDWIGKLLSPRSVALVGASNDPQHTGGRIVGYLNRYGYEGKVFPVNRTRAVVQGMRAYPSIAAIEEPVDIAFITVPASQVPEVLTECGEHGVSLAYVGSSGFAEVGGDGPALQTQLRDAAKQAGVRVIGPNGNGIISVRSRFTASFMSGLNQDRFELSDGPITLISQSGAVGSFIFSMAQSAGVGIGNFISTGNETDVTFEELLLGLLNDDKTRVLLGYVEGLRDPSAFVRAARYAESLGKAIVILKVGTTPEGASAAASHTAALVGEDRAYEGVFTQLGVLRASSLGHLLDIARLLTRFGMHIGQRMSVLTISGGIGIMLSDLASRHGVTVADWPADIQARAQAHLPAWCSTKNPIDTGGAMAKDDHVLRALLEISDDNPESDFTAVCLGNFDKAESAISETLLDLSGQLKKPIMPIWIAGSGLAVQTLNHGGLPCFTEPRSLVEAVSEIAKRHPVSVPSEDTQESLPPQLRALIAGARNIGTRLLDEFSGQSLLDHFGIPTTGCYTVDSEQDALTAIGILGFPVVAKLHSRNLTHRSDHDAVLLDLTEMGQVMAATAQLSAVADRLDLDDARVVLHAQVPNGVELLLGMSVDPAFGPVLTLGIGGIYTEAIEDVEIRLPDVDAGDVAQMLARLHHRRFLEGFRGAPIVTPEVVSPIVTRFAKLVRDTLGEFEAIDLNPVIVHEPGPVVSVVDALFVISESNPAGGQSDD